MNRLDPRVGSVVAVAVLLAGHPAAGESAPTPETPPDSRWSVVIEGEGDSVRYDFTQWAVAVGAEASADIRLEDLEPRHAILEHVIDDGETAFAVYTLSTGLVDVNEGSVETLALYNEGDLVQLGSHVVRTFTRARCESTPRCARLTPQQPAALDDARFVISLREFSGPERLRIPLPHRITSVGDRDRSVIRRSEFEYDHALLWVADEGITVVPIDGVVYIDYEEAEGPTRVAEDSTLLVGSFELHVTQPPLLNPAATATRAVAARAGEFAQDLYRFCHDKNYGQKKKEAPSQYCKLLDESTADACPAAQTSCPWGEAEPAKPWLPNLPIPAEVLRVLFFAVLAVVILWFVVIMIRASRDSEPGIDLAVIEAMNVDVQRLPEAPSQALLRLALDALDKNDPIRATVLAHLAVLRHLDDSGLARFHPSKTNGEYARALRSHPALQALFRRISGQTERLRFGDGVVDPEQVRSFVTEAPEVLRAQRPTSDVGTSTGAAFAVLLLVTTSACGNWGGRPYHSHSPYGMAALPALLRAAGLDTEIGRWPWDELPSDAGVVVLRTSAATKRAWPDALQLDMMLSIRPVVIIDERFGARFLGEARWTEFPDAMRIESYELEKKPGPCLPARLVDAGLKPVTTLDYGAIEIEPRDRVVTSSITRSRLQMMPILGGTETSSTGGQAILWAGQLIDSNAPSCVYVLHLRNLFTNGALTRPENAAFVGAFFASLARGRNKVVFVDRLDGAMVTGAEDFSGTGRAMTASNMLPLLLQGLVSLILLLLAAGAAFGPLRDPVVRTHKAFIEHVEALGGHYARAGQSGRAHAAAALARLVVAQNRDRARAGRGGWTGVVGDLADKHDLSETDVRAALRLGIEGSNELGPTDPLDPPPHSPRMLRTLSRLLSGRDMLRRSSHGSPDGRSGDT